MTNLERYKDTIVFCLREFGDLPGITHNRPVKCDYKCDNCDLDVRREDRHGQSCVENLIHWFSEEADVE